MAPALLAQAQAQASAAAAAAATLPAALRALRAEGAAAFATLGLPTTRNEDWHYTNVRPLAEQAFAPMAGALDGVSAEALAPHRFDAAWPTLVFVNGRYAPSLSSVQALPEGVRVRPLAEAAAEEPELVQRVLGRTAPASRDGFTALNAAFAGEGVFLHVAKEMVSDVPVHVLFVTTEAGAQGMQHPRVLVLAERHARATLVESWVGLTASPYFTNAVAEVVVEDGATLTHLKVQQEGRAAFHVGTIEATQGRDSHYVAFCFTAGAQLSRSNVSTFLGGAGCGTTVNGLTMLDGTQHGDVQTRIEHAEPNCFSREVFKSVLDGRSHGVFNGKVYVRPVAQQTDGKQTNNTLLLSPTAQIDAKPQLEIFADDVKCTHGATVGQIDRTALFYMKSRGVDADTARRLLTYAFAAEVLEMIENEAVREQLERAALHRFTELATVAG
jgi:Fe-S cluster assembly protein SufD